jgi:integrase
VVEISSKKHYGINDIKTLLEEDVKLQELLIIKDPKLATIRTLMTTMKHYYLATGLTPMELIEEAEKEEDNGIKLKNRKIKTHLLELIRYLREKGLKETSISNYVIYVKIFYHTFDIIIPKLPVKLNHLPKKNYKEWITREDIERALKFSNKKLKAIILLMASSGMGSSELRSLSFGDFLNAIDEYKRYPLRPPYKSEDIKNCLPRNQNVIPLWEVQRIKTGSYYYTFSSPESVDAIINYLEHREVKGQPILGESEPLFIGLESGMPYTARAIMGSFERINDAAGFERIGSKRYFTSHELRRFFTDQAFKSGISEREVKWLRGQKTKDTFNRYTKPDPQNLKIEYIEKALPRLSIEKVEIRRIDDNANIRLQKLEKENLELKKALLNEKNQSSKEMDYIKTKLMELEIKQNVTEDLLGDKGVRDELNRREDDKQSEL